MKVLQRASLIILAVPLALVASVIVWWGGSAALASWKEHAFDAVAENSSRASVVSALGSPDTVRPCGKWLWWGDDTQYRGPNEGQCVSEERYEYFLTAYGIGYSADGRVVSKYRYVSE